ncbi:MAG: hypothetical protein U1E70_23040 [Acetobacteraceae bacterium]|nr:hypothetical protein [Pseudomonadota bacterium]
MMLRRFRVALPAWLAVLVCLVLSACGDLPEPFLGNPGATARRLATPLTAVLAVPPGTDTLLPDAASRDLAAEVALSLQASEVPATVRQPQKNDWRVITSVQQQGGQVTPVFSIQDPTGKEQGSAVGEPIPITVWARPDKALYERVAADAGPRIGAVLTSIRITRDKADPNSLYNRAARVLVTDVTGAPGDGNTSLTRQMRTRLAALGPIVLTTPSGADFVVQGEVQVIPIPKAQERVEIVWTVKTGAGQERGKVVQLNEIPAGALKGYWGDIAAVVAAEASAGVNDVIRQQSGRGREPADQAPLAGAGGSAGGQSGAAAPNAGAPGTAASAAAGPQATASKP